MLIGIFSDAHGHTRGFDLAKECLSDAGAEEFYFLGDAIGYIPDVSVVKRLMSPSNIKSIKGNHEVLMLSGASQGQRTSAIYQHAAIVEMLDPAEKEFLESLPLFRTREIKNLKLKFVHGSPSAPTFGYVYPDTDLSQFGSIEADVVFMGHTHRPFVREEAGRLFINVGSCGLPRDNDPRGCACLFDTDRREVKMMRFSISQGSRTLLSRNDIAEPVAAYLKRYADADNED